MRRVGRYIRVVLYGGRTCDERTGATGAPAGISSPAVSSSHDLTAGAPDSASLAVRWAAGGQQVGSRVSAGAIRPLPSRQHHDRTSHRGRRGEGASSARPCARSVSLSPLCLPSPSASPVRRPRQLAECSSSGMRTITPRSPHRSSTARRRRQPGLARAPVPFRVLGLATVCRLRTPV